MKEIIYNYDNLTDKDITETVIRTKALIINDNSIYICNENNIYEFPGGHLEINETLEECLKREIKEEMGMDIIDEEISKPFMKVTYLNQNWPEVGKNRKSEIYYYVVKTNKVPDITKTQYTKHEIKNNFKVEELPLNSAINIIRKNIPNNEKNKVISPDMITAIEEYLYINYY